MIIIHLRLIFSFSNNRINSLEHRFYWRRNLSSRSLDEIFHIKSPSDMWSHRPWAPQETESQSGRGKVVPSGTPARAAGACSRSAGRGNTLTSRFPRSAAPRRSRSRSAWSSECGAFRAEFPTVKEKWKGIFLLWFYFTVDDWWTLVT